MVMTATATDTVRISGDMVIIPSKEFEELKKAKENMEYLAKLDKSYEQLREGKTISLSMEELREMESDDWKPSPKIKEFIKIISCRGHYNDK